jgi:hypothetical protein
MTICMTCIRFKVTYVYMYYDQRQYGWAVFSLRGLGIPGIVPSNGLRTRRRMKLSQVCLSCTLPAYLSVYLDLSTTKAPSATSPVKLSVCQWRYPLSTRRKV